MQTVGGPSRADLHSQGGARGSKMVLMGDNTQTTGNSKPRATSAYGTHYSRRNLNAQMINQKKQGNAEVDETSGANQKTIIGNMKERKLQMRVVGGTQVRSNNFTTTVFNEPPGKVAGVGHGFG